MNGRILITGGLGFLGGRIAKFLQEQYSTSLIIGSRSNHSPVVFASEIPVEKIQWNSQRQLEELCREVDTIIHLAAMNAGDCLKTPLEAWEINVIHTAALIEAAKISDVGRFIYFSTAHVYGTNLRGTVSEETLPLALNTYAATHRAAEDIVLGGVTNQLAGIVLRLSNGVGESMHSEVNAWMLLMNDICLQAATTGQIILNSDGMQWRNFITLEDVARATSHFVSLPRSSIGGGLFNLGGKESKRVMDMARLARERCKIVLGFVPEIKCMVNVNHYQDLPLDYRIDRLLETGFTLTGNFEKEVDKILLMCSKKSVK